MGLVWHRIYHSFFEKAAVKVIPQKWPITKNKRSGKLNNSDFSRGLTQLAESNIIAARMDLGSLMCTNILTLEAELRGYDMALIDDPHPMKKAKLEEQMATVEAEIHKLKANWVERFLLPHKAIYASLLLIDLKEACKDRETTTEITVGSFFFVLLWTPQWNSWRRVCGGLQQWSGRASYDNM